VLRRPLSGSEQLQKRRPGSIIYNAPSLRCAHSLLKAEVPQLVAIRVSEAGGSPLSWCHSRLKQIDKVELKNCSGLRYQPGLSPVKLSVAARSALKLLKAPYQYT